MVTAVVSAAEVQTNVALKSITFRTTGSAVNCSQMASAFVPIATAFCISRGTSRSLDAERVYWTDTW
jgi:hypothetical protein